MSAVLAQWTDLLDPDEAALRRVWPDDLHQQALSSLLEVPEHDDDPRPRMESHGTYVFGTLIVPVVVKEEDRVYYQQVDVVAAEHLVLTVRKTPQGGAPMDLTAVHNACKGDVPAGMIVYHLVDKVAEAFLDLVDDLNDEIEELEDHVEVWPNTKVRHRLSDLRRDLIDIRHKLSPTRDAAGGVIDNRVDIDDGSLFPREVEVNFADAFNKLLRASEGLDSARDFIAGVRDYHQSKVANDQNEVMKTLTIVAALLLFPTFIVGLYGQNFKHIPETGWGQGYGFSWGLIIVITLLQLWYFKRKGWIGRSG